VRNGSAAAVGRLVAGREESSRGGSVSRVGAATAAAASSMCPSDNVELRLRARAANNRDVSNRNYYY